MLSLDTFQDLSYSHQLVRGDMLPPHFIPDVTTKIKVEVTDFDVTKVRKLRSELMRDEELSFRCDYGKLLTPIDVIVDWGCIRAALKFWDQIPTLEEYAMLLCFVPPVSSMYRNIHFESANVKTRLDHLLGITTCKG